MRTILLSLLVPLLLQGEGVVRREPYQGWTETLRVDAARPGMSLIVVPDLGGRIVRYGLGGENLIFENPDYAGKTLENSPAGALDQGYTGYNVDLGPELRGIPKHLPLWVGKHRVLEAGPSIALRSEIDPATRMEITKRIDADPLDGSLRVLQILTNRGDKDAAYCLWDRTLCAGGGFALIPLNASSKLPSGWCQLQNGRYKTDAPSHPGVKILDGVLVAKAEGPSSKIGADSDGGWIAYTRGKQMLVKYYPYFAEGKYTDGGNSVELYFDPKVCELEPLSPEVTMTPSRAYEFMERWLLIPLEKEAAGWEEARDLVKKIPPHPFKRK